jgi:hypothetical protein
MRGMVFEGYCPIVVLKPQKNAYRIIGTTWHNGFVGEKFVKEGVDLDPMDVEMLREIGITIWFFRNGAPEGEALKLVTSA